MANTPEGRQLTELHRLLQVNLSTQSMASTRLLWSTMDPRAGSRAMNTWLKQQVALSGVFDEKSANAAASYVQKFRAAEGFPAGPIKGIKDYSPEWARKSMEYNGSNKIVALMDKGLTPEVAKVAATSGVLAASQRLALGGGRRVVDKSALANPASNGWRRVPDGSPCSFCAMLVSRGPAYHSERSAGAGRHWHKRCGCSIEEALGDWTPTDREQLYVDSYYKAVEDLRGEDRIPSNTNILEKMRLGGGFNDSPTPKIIEVPKIATTGRPYELKRQSDSFSQDYVDSMPEEWQARFVQRQKDRIDAVVGQPVKVTMTDDGLAGFLKDGEMKTMHDVTSSFGDTGSGRDRILQQRTEYETGTMGAPKGAKPIYGWSRTSERMVDNYGDYHVVLKSDVAKRTTVTFGDSLSGLRPLWMDELPTASASDLASATGPIRLNVPEPVKKARGKAALASPKPPDLWREVRYAETQIHGGVNLDDVESIAMTKNAERRLSKAQRDILESKGISVRTIDRAEDIVG